MASTLAANRQRERVQAVVLELDTQLRQQQAALDELSDAQYKLLNESILAMFSTTHEPKMRLLRKAIRNCLRDRDLPAFNAVVLSRIVRDISVEEAAFLFDNFHYARVQFTGNGSDESDPEILTIIPNSEDAAVASGLMSLGLLVGAGPIMNDMGRYAFSPIVAKLLALLRE